MVGCAGGINDTESEVVIHDVVGCGGGADDSEMDVEIVVDGSGVLYVSYRQPARSTMRRVDSLILDSRPHMRSFSLSWATAPLACCRKSPLDMASRIMLITVPTITKKDAIDSGLPQGNTANFQLDFYFQSIDELNIFSSLGFFHARHGGDDSSSLYRHRSHDVLRPTPASTKVRSLSSRSGRRTPRGGGGSETDQFKIPTRVTSSPVPQDFRKAVDSLESSIASSVWNLSSQASSPNSSTNREQIEPSSPTLSNELTPEMKRSLPMKQNVMLGFSIH